MSRRYRTPEPALYVSSLRLEELREERASKRKAEADAAIERIRQRPKWSVWKKRADATPEPTPNDDPQTDAAA